MDSFQLLPVPIELKIPQVILLANREECFLGPLIDSMRDSVEYLFSIKQQLEAKSGNLDDQLLFLDDNKARMRSACNSLQSEVKLVSQQLLRDQGIQRTRLLALWLENSFERMQLAIHWAESAEETLVPQLQQLSEHPSTQVPPPFSIRVVLCCVVLCDVVLCCIVLCCCAVLYCVVLCCVVLCCIVLCVVLCCAVCGVVYCDVVWCGVV